MNGCRGRGNSSSGSTSLSCLRLLQERDLITIILIFFFFLKDQMPVRIHIKRGLAGANIDLTGSRLKRRLSKFTTMMRMSSESSSCVRARRQRGRERGASVISG
jgi:hypothetical protein